MDYEENVDNFAEEDSLPEEIVEDSEESEEDLDAYLNEDEDSDQAAEEEEKTQEPEAREEPGYVKTRITKAVNKAVAETEARFAAQIEAIEAKYAPLQERLMEMDAQELVRSRKVADIETARELVRLRQGVPAQQEQTVEQPRNDQGQFVSQNQAIEMARTEERIEMLKAQAAYIKDKSGVDVIAEWNNNPEVKKAVMDGEMDFYQVAEQMQKRQKKRPPSPTRSPNGANGIGPQSIANMSDAQFRKMDKKLDEGVRFTIKR